MPLCNSMLRDFPSRLCAVRHCASMQAVRRFQSLFAERVRSADFTNPGSKGDPAAARYGDTALGPKPLGPGPRRPLSYRVLGGAAGGHSHGSLGAALCSCPTSAGRAVGHVTLNELVGESLDAGAVVAHDV